MDVWKLRSHSRHVQGAVPAEPQAARRGRGRRPSGCMAAAEGGGERAVRQTPRQHLGRSSRVGVPSAPPSPVGDVEVQRGLVTSSVPGTQHTAEPGASLCSGPHPSRDGGVRARAGRVQAPGTCPRRGSSWPKHRGNRGVSRVTPDPGTTRSLCPLFARPRCCCSGRGCVSWPRPIPQAAYYPHTQRWENTHAPKHGPGTLHPASLPPGGRHREGPSHLLSCGPRKAVGCLEKGRASSRQGSRKNALSSL